LWFPLIFFNSTISYQYCDHRIVSSYTSSCTCAFDGGVLVHMLTVASAPLAPDRALKVYRPQRLPHGSPQPARAHSDT
jgi:hypothetical protein